MGIPSYFSHIIKNYSNIIRKQSGCERIQHLLMDCNSIIYDSFRELEEKYKAIPWVTMLRGWGLSEKRAADATFIVTNVKYIRHLNYLFHEMEHEAWRVWMNSMVVLNF